MKRVVDVVFCSAILVLGLPVFVVIGVMVKLSSPGSVFFVQPRMGKGEKEFRLIKFRTMAADSNRDSAVWTTDDEDRITPIGRFLRDYGLDELPQVLNILKGEMSIVGPRPPLPIQVQDYTEHQRRIFDMRPGVLSLAAVKGRRSIPLDERIELHIEYVEKWSLRLDLMILWRSLFVVLLRQDAAESIQE